VNDYLWELLTMIQAAKLASASRITAVMPWFPYSRQDKKSAPREPITAKLVADTIEAGGVDRVITMDLHAGQIQGFFTIPVDHMTALQLFAQYYRDKGLHGDGVVAVSPDPGRAKMAGKFAEMLEADLAIMNKTRPEHDVAAVTEVIGHVHGKVAVMTDDLIVTGGTLVAGAVALKAAGATEVYACATHGLFPDVAAEKLGASELTEITVTDTVPINPITKPANLQVLPVSGLLAETIQNVFSGESVSAIFAGENQLF
jgi:ribose-phosphate pyrophosphokinase